MVQPTLFSCLRGAVFLGLLAAAAPGAAADTVRVTRHHRKHPSRALSSDDGQSKNRSDSDAQQSGQSGELPEKGVSESARSPRTPANSSVLPTPVNPDRDAVRLGARQFRLLLDQKRVRLLNDDRDRGQIDCLCLDGLFQWPLPVVAAAPRDNSGPDTDIYGPQAPDDAVVRTPDRNSSRRDIRRPQASPLKLDSDIGSQDGIAPKKAAQPIPIPCATAPPLELFQMLNALASHSSPEKPLTIMSFLRPPYRTSRYYMQSPTNPHALGIAVDISAFGGHTISTAQPEEEVQACLALLKTLAPGRYRLGLPKAPEPPRPFDIGVGIPPNLDGDPAPSTASTDRQRGAPGSTLPSRGARRQDGVHRSAPTADIRPDPLAPTDSDVEPVPPLWPFFPPPQKGLDERGRQVTLFANERYAAEEFLNDARLRTALVEARRRGVDVFAMFPDGVNHIHVDVKRVP